MGAVRWRAGPKSAAAVISVCPRCNGSFCSTEYSCLSSHSIFPAYYKQSETSALENSFLATDGETQEKGRDGALLPVSAKQVSVLIRILSILLGVLIVSSSGA